MAEKSKVIESKTYMLHPDGSEVKLTIHFLDEFDNKDFQKCIADFMKVQTKKGKPTEWESYEMPKIYKIKKGLKKKELPDFDYFKKTSSEFLYKIINDVLTEMPELLELSTKQIEIHVDIIGSEERGYYASHEEKISGPAKIVIELSGKMLVGRVVAPEYFIGRTSYRFVEKILLHEFRHHVELLRGVYKREYEQYEKLKKDMITKYKRANIGRLSLHTALCNLLSEGVAEYYMTRWATKKDINMYWIRGFREKLKALVLIQEENDAITYMNENIESDRGPTVYYCGKIMCYFIGLAKAKKKGKAGDIKIHVGKQAFDISKLNEIMNIQKKFYMDRLPPKSFKSAVKTLNKIHYYKKFIKKYEEACKELGIEEKNMTISQNILAEIRKESKENFTKHLSAGMPRQTSRLHLLKERIMHFFYRQSSQQSLPSGSQKPS